MLSANWFGQFTKMEILWWMCMDLERSGWIGDMVIEFRVHHLPN